MTDSQVQDAYAERASEYTAILGSVDDMHELDRNCINRWAESVQGRLLDAGCGPGHWTDFLSKRGHDVFGVDLVPEFVESAKMRFPATSFRVSSLRALDETDGSLGGILAWYSLIHVPPAELSEVLSELARVLMVGGCLLVGFFEGESTEPLNHSVTQAYFWSVDEMSSLLSDAGFDVIEVETRQDLGSTPHAAISAILR